VVHSSTTGARFLPLSGKLISKPVARRGPVVMNTKEELTTVFDEIGRGTLIKQ
jgi:redox-sensitive bicupin YhaK (pirin superfamily)